MAEKKNHHFVPQSYQRLFSNDGKSIGVYKSFFTGCARNWHRRILTLRQ